MTKTTRKALKRHFARYTGGLAGVVHSGRISKIIPFRFSPRQWVEIPKDPCWMCVECNKKFWKHEVEVKPTECGNEYKYMSSITDHLGAVTGGRALRKVCRNTKFTDSVQRRFFKMKADKNPTWEYKTE